MKATLNIHLKLIQKEFVIACFSIVKTFADALIAAIIVVFFVVKNMK